MFAGMDEIFRLTLKAWRILYEVVATGTILKI
jgi:hypothetical protein